jgi:hypothetical protein
MPAAIPGIGRLKKLRRQASYRARRSTEEDFREGERQRTAKWRGDNPGKVREQRYAVRLANYNRPFVAIDSEGQDYRGADIVYDGVRYPDHATYLWGAAADDGRPPVWLSDPETAGLDHRPLDAVRILDWLLDLRRQFGPAVFVAFSFGYDVTQLLRHLPYKTVWEIIKRETYPDAQGRKRPIGNSPVLWKGYAIKYTKGKSLELWRLADPNRPYKGKRLSTSAHIRVYDVFGFFQSSFSLVTKSMVDSGRAAPEEAGFIVAMKDRREQFANENIDQIRAYTTLELQLLARMMGDLRKGFSETGLRLRHWHGAGAAASTLIETLKLKQHYGPDIAASNRSPQQDAAMSGP